jgi:hypothetical protein
MYQQNQQVGMSSPQPKVRTWLWVVFLIVIILAGGFFAWYYFYGPGKTTTATTTTPVATDKTADWKTYSNDTYLFSFKYPTDWETNATTALKDSTGKAYLTNVMYRPKTMTEDYLGAVKVTDSTLANQITEEKNALKDSDTFVAQATAKVGTETATTLTFQNKEDSTIKPIIYLLEKNSKVYIITGEGNLAPTTANTTTNANVKLLINSFKFTTAASSATSTTANTTVAKNFYDYFFGLTGTGTKATILPIYTSTAKPYTLKNGFSDYLTATLIASLNAKYNETSTGAGGVDPIVCAQEFPTNVTYASSGANTVLATMNFTTPIVATLGFQNGKINTITCP